MGLLEDLGGGATSFVQHAWGGATGALGMRFPSVGGYRTAAEQRSAFTHASEVEQQARASLFNDSVKDPTLDPISKNELAALYDSGATSDQIAALLNSAREGKGIYAVRKQNQMQGQIMADMPGRSQILNLSPPSILGPTGVNK